jgi:hypothetical protein
VGNITNGPIYTGSTPVALTAPWQALNITV